MGLLLGRKDREKQEASSVPDFDREAAGRAARSSSIRLTSKQIALLQSRGVDTGDKVADNTKRVSGYKPGEFDKAAASRAAKSSGVRLTTKQLADLRAKGVDVEGVVASDSGSSSGQTAYNESGGTDGSEGSSSTRITGDSSSAVADEDAIGADLVSLNERAGIEGDIEDFTDSLNKLQKDLEDQIEDERKALDDRRKEELEGINERLDIKEDDLERQQKQQTAAETMALARSGGFLGQTASHRGVLQNLVLTQQQELRALDNIRENALRAANAAYEDRDFELARELIQSARDTEQEIYNRTQEFNELIRDQAEKESDELANNEQQTSIYNAIQKIGGTDVGKIFEELGGTVPIEAINSFLNNLNPSIGDGYTFTSSQVGGLIGGGMGQDEIKAFNAYVNENGYDEAIRSSLTVTQRAAADKIFRDTKKITGTDDLNKMMSTSDLIRIEEMYDVRFPFGVTAGQVSAVFMANPGISGDELQAAIDVAYPPVGSAADSTGGGGDNSLVGEGIDVNMKFEFTEEWFRDNLSEEELKAFADYMGTSNMLRHKSAKLFWLIDSDIEDFLTEPGIYEEIQKKVEALRAQGKSDAEILTAITR